MTNSETPSAAAAINEEIRIDLHVHSRFSNQPYSWFLRSAEAAECYTEPTAVYATAKARGMNLVTLCDHDTIDGALELRAHADDTFISEEVSARFPEDGCVVHTIALHISEAQHHEIQRLRRNVYELVSYLHHQGVEFFLCHPLSQVNRRLTVGHLERCLLMFRNLELRNGTRDVSHEKALRRILGGVTPTVLAGFAQRHPQTPVFNHDARYGLVGGSDDHAGLSIARAFTTFTGARSGAGVTEALRARRTQPGGHHGTTAVLQHNVYGVIAGHIQATAATESESATPAMAAMLAGYVDTFAAAQRDDGPVDFAAVASQGHSDAFQQPLQRVVESVLVRSTRQAMGAAADHLMAKRLIDFADAVPALLKATIVSLPAVLGARWQGHDVQSARRFSAGLGFGERGRRSPRVAVLTDTIDDVNGVSLGLRRLRAAAEQTGHDLRLVSCGAGDHVTVDDDGVVRLPSVLRHRLPQYPQMEFAVPHLASLIAYLLENDIDLVQCSTPGPVGFVGLLAARLAGKPVVGQFHTDVPEYATRLTGDPMVGAVVGAAVGWFYGALDRVFAPSQAVVRRLHDLGVGGGKIARLPRGIDLDLFSPARRDPHALAAFGLTDESKVVYVGRLSREKNLEPLLDGFALAARTMPAARLLMIGDGPQAAALAERAAQGSTPGQVQFLGERRGAELATLLASADLFVSPSETETFGNTVVEAQASGLPVIVAGRGAAAENVVDGITGLVVDARRPEEIAGAIRRLLADAPARTRMARAAAGFAQRYDLRAAAEATFREYRRFLGERADGDDIARPAAPPSSVAAAHAVAQRGAA